ncbi:MAG TPA: gluconokinase [Chitinophagaceae bacterium]
MKFILGIDIGTTFSKIVAVGIDGEILYQSKADYPTIQSLPGQSEQDADSVFEAVMVLIRGAIKEFRTGEGLKDHSLTAICFSAAMHSVLAVDKEGRALTNAFTWADTRSHEQAAGLKNRHNAGLLYRKTGTPIHSMSPFCKIAWMRQAMPEKFEAAEKFISIKEYIYHKLFGKYVVDHSIASATGLFDNSELLWCEEALEAVNISTSKLSLPVPVTHFETAVKEEYRKLMGVPENIPFIIGASDGCLANLGSGAILKGEGALTIGTSGAIRVVSGKSIPDPGERLFNYILADGLFVTGGPVSNGGAALKWFAENFLQGFSTDAKDINLLAETSLRSSPGAEGLLFLPYLSGERAPYWDAAARGAFIGLQISHKKEHLVRAVLEGISFALLQVLEAVEETNGDIHTLYASGGFTASNAWLQLVSDVLNKKIIVTGTADASAVGAALLGMKAMGLLENWEQSKLLIKQQRTFEPDHKMHQLYQPYFGIYKRMYPILKDDFHRLGKLQQL